MIHSQYISIIFCWPSFVSNSNYPPTWRPGEYRQRNVHTTIFKLFESGEENVGDFSIGQLHGPRGEPRDTWELCQQLANYWSNSCEIILDFQETFPSSRSENAMFELFGSEDNIKRCSAMLSVLKHKSHEISFELNSL